MMDYSDMTIWQLKTERDKINAALELRTKVRASQPEAVERDAERYRWLRDLALAWQWKDLAKFAYEETPKAVDDAIDSFRSISEEK